MDELKCPGCKHYTIDLYSGPVCELTYSTIANMDVDNCQRFEPLILPCESALGAVQMDEKDYEQTKEELEALSDGTALSMIMAVLHEIDAGTPIGDIKAQLQEMGEEFTEKLMKTEPGRRRLEIIHKYASMMEEAEK